jgi:putative hydrolase of the HAD superfamily
VTRTHLSLVVFDLDGVLYDFQPARRLAYLSEVTGRDPDWIQSTIWGSEFEAAAEAGAYLTGEAYLDAFNARLGYPLTRDQWVAARRVAMSPQPAMLGLIQAVRPHIGLAVLTNNGALFRDTLPLLAPELTRPLAIEVHVSCDFGCRKPDAPVYQRLVERHGLAPSAVVFVDDNPANVRGAVAVGLRGIVFENVPQLAAELGRLLGITLDASLGPAAASHP